MDEVLTVSELSKYLKLSTQVIRRLPIPRTQVGRIIRFKKCDVEAWLEANKKAKGAKS